MKYLFLLAFLLLSLNGTAQKNYSVSKDSTTGQAIFRGRITLDDLAQEPSFHWLAKGEKEYRPDSTIMAFLKTELPKYSLVVFMGTWCDDSHYLIPKLAKILKLTDFPMEKLVLYGVDRAKKTGGIEPEMLKVSLVPTFILFQGHLELGRVVESVSRSLEADLARIIALNQKTE